MLVSAVPVLITKTTARKIEAALDLYSQMAGTHLLAVLLNMPPQNKGTSSSLRPPTPLEEEIAFRVSTWLSLN
jgi:hypothetical protein